MGETGDEPPATGRYGIDSDCRTCVERQRIGSRIMYDQPVRDRSGDRFGRVIDRDVEQQVLQIEFGRSVLGDPRSAVESMTG